MGGKTASGFWGRLSLSLSAIFLFWLTAGSSAGAFEITVAPNTKAPAFTLKDLSGKNVSLTALRGKVILLNFWATWCSPCKKEMPDFEKLYGIYNDRGFEVLGVSINSSEKRVQRFLEKIPVTFPVLMDDGSKVSKLYKVYSIPTTFLIDKSGLIVKKYQGPAEWTSREMKGLIEELLQ